MEELRSRIPEPLLTRIEESNERDVPYTTSQLLASFNIDPIFYQILGPLSLKNETTCSKSQEMALKFKSKGNDSFKCNSFQQAMVHFTEALRFMPVRDKSYKVVAILYTNRAACFHKLALLREGERDCTRAIHYEEKYSKAWYRRGCIRQDMLNYTGAIQDLKAAHFHESSVSGKTQVQKELENLSELPTSSKSWDTGEEMSSPSTRNPDVKIELYVDSAKGWGLRTIKDAHPGSLVHLEEANAAIILKERRKSHCHFCFEALPADCVPCNGCAVPFYCSDTCRNDAAAEHEPECGGTSWAAVVPTDAALACRLLRYGSQVEGLCQHYDKLSPSSKVELHLLGVVLATCLNQYSKTTSVKDLASKIILLIAKVRSNAMAITHVSSSNNLTLLNGIEHVKVAQGVFFGGSKFNHSCKPNIHASYTKRHLYVHATQHLPATSPLEQSYGAQVGDSGRSSRQKWLAERYFFDCKCAACVEGVTGDILISAYRCCSSDCDGVVLEGADSQLHLSRCLKCAAILDKHALTAAKKSLERIERLDSTVAEGGQCCPNEILDQALKALENGRRYFHPWNKNLGRMEDIMAKLCCAAKQPLVAMQHCETSTEIIKRVYGNQHIAVAFELVKLASLARLCDSKSSQYLDEASKIFSNHYGIHYKRDFPHISSLLELKDETKA